MSSFAPRVEDVIAQTDRAETFGESDVSLSGWNGMHKSGESVRLNDGTSGSVSRASDDGTTYGYEAGTRFTVETSGYYEVTATFAQAAVKADGGCALKNAADGTQIDGDGTTLSDGDTATLAGSLDASEEYVFVFQYNSATGEDTTYETSGTFPISCGPGQLTGSQTDGSDTDGRTAGVSNISISRPTATSGQVNVAWPEPPDVFRWDAVTYQQSPDGETVTVNVETDDGSGWTETQSNVSAGETINADSSDRVRFGVSLSRSSTSNNPALDAIYRRWIVGP